MFQLRAALTAALFQLFSAQALLAQDVTLTSRDGSIEITGALIGYDGEFYRVDTIYGVLTVDGSGVLCAGPGCPDLSTFIAEVRLSGTPAAATRLMPALIEAFAIQQNYTTTRIASDDSQFTLLLQDVETDHDVARFVFRTSTSDEGFADLLADEADIALSTREVTEGEATRGRDAGIGRLDGLKQSRVIALDALVPIVSPVNPVRTISPTDLYRAFSGELDNWQQLGGVDAPIDLHMVSAGSGLAHVLRDYLHREKFSLAGNIIQHGSSLALAQAVSDDPFALGVSVLSKVGDAKRLTLADSCGFRSVASEETLRTEDYPLTAPLFIYLPQRRQPVVAREFLRFIRSPAAQVAVRRAGFAGQSMSEIPVSRQGDRLANAIRAAGPDVTLAELQRLVTGMDGAKRLTISFRFEGGSSALDAQSRSNIVLMARALESGDFDSRELVFAGFSDGDGTAESNVRLSRLRAASVRSAILREAPTADPSRLTLRVEAFGEAMPMACDDTEWGRQVNRRVEVWVR